MSGSSQLTVYYKCRNWGVLVSSVLLIFCSVLILVAGWRSRWAELRTGARIFYCAISSLAILMFLSGCKGVKMYLFGIAEPVSLDSDRIIFRNHSVQWAEIRDMQLIHNSNGVCVSIVITAIDAFERISRLDVPLWPGVSQAESDAVVNFIARSFRKNRGSP